MTATVIRGADGDPLATKGVCKERIFQTISVTTQVEHSLRMHRCKLEPRGHQAAEKYKPEGCLPITRLLAYNEGVYRRCEVGPTTAWTKYFVREEVLIERLVAASAKKAQVGEQEGKGLGDGEGGVVGGGQSAF